MGRPEDKQKSMEDKEVEAGQLAEKKHPYPKQVFFIVGNEFCERFSYYGMKAILVIYFKSKLHFNEDDATIIYHTFSLFCYFTPILGALLADQFLGKFKTIIYISILYILGHLLKTLAAVTPLGLPPVEFSLIGLALIALGTGGIKPCVAAFGGDQFKLPEQERQLQTFFSVFYFSINIGALASTFLTPILRQDVSCFDSDDHTCYSLAFGVPALLMFVATVILIIGKPFYVFKPPQGNILTQVFGAIWNAISNRGQHQEKSSHWLDKAKDKYDHKLVEDTKVLLRVLRLFLPLPVFWALFDQQGSRWTFQATRMNGQVGSFIIKPDQMQLVNAAFILILIPLFDGIVYPLFAKVNLLVKPLHRIFVGGILAALAFFVSGMVELELQQTYEKIPGPGLSNLNVMNTLNCPLSVSLYRSENFTETFEIEAKLNYILNDLEAGQHTMKAEALAPCGYPLKEIEFETEEEKVKGIFAIGNSADTFELYESRIDENPKKTENTYPKLRVFYDLESTENQTVYLKKADSNTIVYSIQSTVVSGMVAESNYITVSPNDYRFFIGEGENITEIGSLNLQQGGVYTLAVTKTGLEDFVLTKANSIHMLWLIPQYFILTTGEIMFSITGLEFSYSKAPSSMKSVVQAAWLWTVAFGNLIVILVAELKSESLSQASEFFMFGSIMVADMLVFGVLAFWFQTKEAAQKEGIDNPVVNNEIAMEERKDTALD